MSVHIWTPGIAGPLDEFVSRILRMVAAFAQEHRIEQAEVCVELFDGSRHLLETVTAEPGFGFLSFVPYRSEGGEPKRMIVPVGAVRAIEISVPDPEQPFGFAITE